MSEVSLVAAIFAGAASFLSPCVVPLIPGYLSLMSGYSMGELSAGEVDMRRVFGMTALFFLGFTVVFVALGATATTLSAFLNRPIFTVVAGWVIVAMGLFIAVTAVWQPRFLLPLMRERRVEMQRARRFGILGPPLMGGAFAFGWTPCIGPFLAATLALAANTDTVYQGMVVLLFYSLGLGIPFLLVSVGLAKAFSALEWVKRRLVPFTVASGALLAVFGLLMVTGKITVLSSWFTQILVRLGLEGLATI